MSRKRVRRRNKQANILVTTENISSVKIFDDRENLIKRMSDDAIAEVKSIIQDRYDSAREVTDKVASDMNRWELIEQGKWQNPENHEDDIFLPKTREALQTVYSYILLLVSQLNPIVTMLPFVSTIFASDEEFRKAKVTEALFHYYMDDVWNFKTDKLPKWLKTFLKFTIGVWKITYREDSFLPDLNIDIVDRALLYFDPTARDLKECRWVIEKYFLTRTEVLQRIDDGHWYVNDDFYPILETGFSSIPDLVLKRYFGERYSESMNIQEDELIEIWEYWQAPSKGLDDAYAVMIGGEDGILARYGRNPFPYKGIPYRGKSFDPHEYKIDGKGLVEHQESIQKVVNTLLNLRLTDVRKNIIQPVAATGKFIDAQTQEDFKTGSKIVRLSEEVLEASKDPSFDLRKHFVNLPFSTSTGELLTGDLPFMLSMANDSSNVSEVFRGQAPSVQSTLGQIQEQLQRNQGVFRPIYMQVMRSIEEIAEIACEYFRSEEFFPTDRIISIIGENKYKDVIEGWHQPKGSNMNIREVSPDELDVKVNINAVNGADAMASRTFLMSSFEQIFQSIGQIPELFAVLKEEIDFPKMVEMMINVSGQDIDGIKLSPEQKQEKAQQAQQQKQAQEQEVLRQQQLALQFQSQMEQMKAQAEMLKEQNKQQARAEAQSILDEHKSLLEIRKATKVEDERHDNKIAEITHQIAEQLKSDMTKMLKEFTLEQKAASIGESIAVGHGNEINS